jgi:hypothetical protein
MNALHTFYDQQPEPLKSTLLALKAVILAQDADITHEWKYGMPFFCYKGKMFCYLWVQKKTGQPYLGLVEGKHFDQPFLLQEKRSRMKIYLLHAEEDLPIDTLEALVNQALVLYKTGIVT